MADVASLGTRATPPFPLFVFFVVNNPGFDSDCPIDALRINCGQKYQSFSPVKIQSIATAVGKLASVGRGDK